MTHKTKRLNHYGYKECVMWRSKVEIYLWTYIDTCICMNYLKKKTCLSPWSKHHYSSAHFYKFSYSTRATAILFVLVESRFTPLFRIRTHLSTYIFYDDVIRQENSTRRNHRYILASIRLIKFEEFTLTIYN